MKKLQWIPISILQGIRLLTVPWSDINEGYRKKTGLNVSGMDRLGCVRAAIAERQIYPIFVSDVLFGRVVALKYFIQK